MAIINYKTSKNRKPQQCSRCNQPIQVGTTHAVYTTMSTGAFHTNHLCVSCMPVDTPASTAKNHIWRWAINHTAMSTEISKESAGTCRNSFCRASIDGECHNLERYKDCKGKTVKDCFVLNSGK